MASVILDKLIGLDVTKKVSVPRNASLHSASATQQQNNTQQHSSNEGRQQGLQAESRHADRQKHLERQFVTDKSVTEPYITETPAAKPPVAKHQPVSLAQCRVQPPPAPTSQLPAPKGVAATCSLVSKAAPAAVLPDQSCDSRHKQFTRQAQHHVNAKMHDYRTAQPGYHANLAAGFRARAAAQHDPYNSANSMYAPDDSHTDLCNPRQFMTADDDDSNAAGQHKSAASAPGNTNVIGFQAAANVPTNIAGQGAANGRASAGAQNPAKTKRRLLSNVFTVPYAPPAKTTQVAGKSAAVGGGQEMSSRANNTGHEVRLLSCCSSA